MKPKYIFVLLFLIFGSFSSYLTPVSALEKIYGRILNNNIYFFSQPIDDESAYLFIIPNTYFVEITSKANDTNDLFYCAKYMGLSGYVKKDEVCLVSGKPSQPFANTYSFRMFIPNGVELRSSPSSTNPFNIICTIPYLTTNLIYIGNILGEEQISQKGKTWIYCKYVDNSDTYYGYVYSAFCDLIPTIQNNNEVMSDFEGDPFEEKTEEVATDENIFLVDSNLKYIVIIAVCIPGIFIVYLLFKPTKLCVDNGKSKNKIHRLKKSEFYEFDD